MAALPYSLRTVEFSGRSTYIVCCGKDINASLVSIANFLLLSEGPPASLKNATRGAHGELSVDRSSLVDLFHNLMVQRVRKHVREGRFPQDQIGQLLKSAKSEIIKLAVKLDLVPGFESNTCFQGVISDYIKLLIAGLDADIYHGILPDPVEDNILCNLVEGKNLVDFLALRDDLSEIDKKLISDLMNMKDPLTPYGLSCLQKDVPENSLSLLWHTCCVSVLYKHEGVLYLLSTSVEHPDQMWFSVENHELHGNPFSSSFSPINLLEKTEDIIIDRQVNPEDIAKDLIEEEEKAKAHKLVEENKAKGREKKRGKHNNQKNPGRTSGKAAVKEKAKKKQTATEPTLRDRFTDFLFGFRKDGCVKPYFMGQIEALNYCENLDLEFSYSLIKEYNENLALSVAANYHSVLSFNQFISKYVLYLVFKLDNLSFDSTTYVGRQMGKGYLKFILKKHKSGWSWNGEFSEKDMFVVIVGSSMEFVITLPADQNFNRDRGVNDCNKYIDILIPLYKSHKDATTPWYLDKLKADFMKMPDHDPMNPEPFDNFQLFIGEHLGWKAPLVRSAFTCNLFRVFRSLVFNENQAGDKKGVYLPLDITDGLIDWKDFRDQFCAPLHAVYMHKAPTLNDSRYNRHSFCYVLWLGRNATEHLFDHAKVNGVQLITDVIISDLILEHDLRGLLSDVVYKAMELTKFSGEFASIWRHFTASEMFDDLEKLLCVEGSAGTESADTAACEDTNPSKVDAAAAIIIALSKALESLGHSSEAIAAALGTLGYSLEDAAASASKFNTAASSSDPAECVTSAGKPNAVASSSISPEFVASANKPNTVTSAPNSSRPPVCVLRHGRATLNRWELMTLQGNGWVGDAVINYVFALPSTSYKDLCFVGPGTSLVLTNLKDADAKTVNAEASGLNLGSCNLVLFPVSDNMDFDNDNQGKHWSLLILHFSNDRSKCRFIYHDTVFKQNLSHARRLAYVLSHIIPEVTEFVEAESPTD